MSRDQSPASAERAAGREVYIAQLAAAVVLVDDDEGPSPKRRCLLAPNAEARRGFAENIAQAAGALPPDVTLIAADGSKHSAHRLILSAWSPFFKTMFSSGMREQNSGEATFPDVDSEHLRQLLGWMYGNEVTIRCESVAAAMALLEIAQRWQIEELTEQLSCGDVVALSEETLVEVWEKAKMLGASSLARRCLDFALLGAASARGAAGAGGCSCSIVGQAAAGNGADRGRRSRSPVGSSFGAQTAATASPRSSIGVQTAAAAAASASAGQATQSSASAPAEPFSPQRQGTKGCAAVAGNGSPAVEAAEFSLPPLLRRLTPPQLQEVLASDRLPVETEEDAFAIASAYVSERWPDGIVEEEVDTIFESIRWRLVPGKFIAEQAMRHPAVRMPCGVRIRPRVLEVLADGMQFDLLGGRARELMPASPAGRVRDKHLIPIPRFESLCPGIKVRVWPEVEGLRRICQRRAPGAARSVRWVSDMKSLAGREVVLYDTNEELRAGCFQILDNQEWWLPFNALLVA
eukprot:TRINITY_DN18777_c0_g1_i1.p1 TRINITY_DN18777_c0_g1~~TRINITY_DN18777_c0_g1_i1.p1  ORF type:complete len:520 (+),score=101.94 TRINITY_DN18777_c0_g1_i1:42-1601(+)